MRKIFMAAVLLICTLLTVQASAQDNPAQIKIDYGKSKIYSQAEMDEAISLIKEQFGKWRGCTLYNIRYAGDENNSAENLKWLNELSEARHYDVKFTQAIEFLSDFYVSKEAAQYTTLNPNSEYMNWQWWLARGEGGEWLLVTWGY